MASLDKGINPMTVKKSVAFHIVHQYHSEEKALVAQRFFEQQFQQREMEVSNSKKYHLPELGIDEVPHPALVDICKELQPAMSKSHLRRLIESGGVTVNGIRLTDPGQAIDVKALPVKVKLGKRGFFEIR